jgi:hypothetical protein
MVTTASASPGSASSYASRFFAEPDSPIVLLDYDRHALLDQRKGGDGTDRGGLCLGNDEHAGRMGVRIVIASKLRK